MMRVLSSTAEVHRNLRGSSRRRVFVPTMGALHRGHIELMRHARGLAAPDGEVAVSIFVNPLQFAPGADYDRYPRNDAADEQICREAGVDILFRPSVAEMYASDCSVFVDETELAQLLEGRSRPGHFRGVCTVVAKLFNIIVPQVAVFGEKDFQQLAIVRRMVRDLDMPVEIASCATVREADGLACSSRNRYLDAQERAQAPVLHHALVAARELGSASAAQVLEQARAVISSAPLARIDYIELVDSATLQPVERVGPNCVLLLAVLFGQTRLIDNIRLG